MNYVIILNEHEKNLVESARQRESKRKERIDKQANCEHNWRYVCACHNDDAYECTKCGASDYR